MADDPVEPSSPSEGAIGQLGQEGSIKRGEVSISLEGILEEIVRVAIRPFDLIEDFKTDRPWILPSQNFPVLAISSSLAIRSSMGGWVLNNERTPFPVNGLTMNICAVEGLACMGILCAARSSFPSALAK